jgi:hypothetical protein
LYDFIGNTEGVGVGIGISGAGVYGDTRENRTLGYYHPIKHESVHHGK